MSVFINRKFNSHFRFLRHRHRWSLWKQSARSQHNKARVVLLPEVPADTAETNAFIRCVENNSLPDFSSWAFKDSVAGTARTGLEYEGWLLDHFHKDGEPAEEREPLDVSSFASLIDPLERHGAPVQFAWHTCRQHYAVLYFGSENAASHVNGLQKMIRRITHIRFSTPIFHRALKKLAASEATRDPWQAQLVRRYLLECHLNGLDLKPHKARQLGEIRTRLEDKKKDYWEHVLNSCVKLRERVVENLADMLDPPEHVLRYLAGNPENPIRLPFTIRYSPPRFSLYLQYCKRRTLRWSWWNAVNNRAAFIEEVALFNNSIIVEEMRQVREREAKWLGYKTYAESQLRVCMAESVDEVKTFLTKFGERAADELDVVYEDMCRIADGEHSSKEPPDAWDLAYYARRVAAEKYKLNQHEFAEYFPYPRAMKNILRELGRLFGIEFRDATKSAPRWHPTVEAYEIWNQSTGRLIGRLYIDPYSRNGKVLDTFALEGRPKSDVANLTPIAYLNLSLTPPAADKPSLIYLDQLSALGFELGKALQYVLTGASYSDMAEVVEWDCKDVCGRVMELLVTGRPKFLASISSHYQSGKKLDAKEAERYVKGGVMANLPSVVREVVESELDLSLYSTRAFWRDTYGELHAKYLPYKWDKKKGDEFVCNFGGYVTENTAAKYFSVLWAKKLASDVVKAFEEAELEGESALEAVGRRYADAYLLNGGKYPQAETFKRFRGRDPTLEPMFKHYVAY